jgi:hypothetical protein
MSSRHATSIIDVRTCRGPNCDSDHFLVKAILRDRLSNTYKQKGAKRIKWDLDKLKEPNYLKQYQNTLEELLRINSDQHTEENDNADIEVEKE